MIHIHAAVYSGWPALFIAQAAFAATGRVALHLRLGKIGMWYGLVVILVGVAILLGADSPCLPCPGSQVSHPLG